MNANVALRGTQLRASRKSTRKRSPYTPPPHSSRIQLSDALACTDRFPSGKQFELVRREDNGRADIPLYFAGDIALLKRPCVAIVGTRKASEAGIARTKRLAKELVSHGIVIVSGLATGIDTVAHTTAIECGGSTIAVIGTPLDKAYPEENYALQERIYRDHLLISQFTIGTKVYPSSFPTRNKLMAKLSDATVVMEASNTSGTTHQAAECTNLGRWLFIAQSVIDDPNVQWPAKFLKYETTVPLTNVSDITSRIRVGAA